MGSDIRSPRRQSSVNTPSSPHSIDGFQRRPQQSGQAKNTQPAATSLASPRRSQGSQAIRQMSQNRSVALPTRPPQRPGHGALRHQELPQGQLASTRVTGGITKKAVPQRRKSHHAVRKIVLAALGLLLVFIAFMIVWFILNLGAPDAGNTTKHKFVIEDGASSSRIASDLEQQKLIKSSLAFQIYTKLTGKKIEAGAHLLSPSYTVSETAMKLATAETDEISVTIPPGLTLKELRVIFNKAGYTDQEVDAAYAKKYTHKLLADKPASAGLEGYIFPDTYNIYATDSLETLIEKTFDNFYDKLQSSGDLTVFQSDGLSLYQAITLASIVQKEVSGVSDQKLVAGVFFNRLAIDMTLGSDVTYIYGASLTGETPSPTLDSPYNTRIHKGLPPGPISNVKMTAVDAVAHPTESDYLYFVAGDDGKTYFAKTDTEHQNNINKYCTDLCQ